MKIKRVKSMLKRVLAEADGREKALNDFFIKGDLVFQKSDRSYLETRRIRDKFHQLGKKLVWVLFVAIGALVSNMTPALFSVLGISVHNIKGNNNQSDCTDVTTKESTCVRENIGNRITTVMLVLLILFMLKSFLSKEAHIIFRLVPILLWNICIHLACFVILQTVVPVIWLSVASDSQDCPDDWSRHCNPQLCLWYFVIVAVIVRPSVLIAQLIVICYWIQQFFTIGGDFLSPYLLAEWLYILIIISIDIRICVFLVFIVYHLS